MNSFNLISFCISALTKKTKSKQTKTHQIKSYHFLQDDYSVAFLTVTTILY